MFNVERLRGLYQGSDPDLLEYRILSAFYIVLLFLLSDLGNNNNEHVLLED